MRVKHSWRVTGRVLLVIAAIAIAATQLIGTTAKAADPIKVGWVGPLSPPGGYAEGALMKQAAEIAAEELNARGGVLGRPIQVVFADTRGKPEEGTAAAERLISQEKVVAITGEFPLSVFRADQNSTEFTAQIERFKSHQPLFDFFMTFYSEAGAYPLVSQSHTLGFAPTARTGMANSGGPAVDPTFWKNVGQAGRYLVTE